MRVVTYAERAETKPSKWVTLARSTSVSRLPGGCIAGRLGPAVAWAVGRLRRLLR